MFSHEHTRAGKRIRRLSIEKCRVLIRLCKLELARFWQWNSEGGVGREPIDHEWVAVRLLRLKKLQRLYRLRLPWPADEQEGDALRKAFNDPI